MWYLSRTPQLTSTSEESKDETKPSTLICTTSIFPTTDSGLFDEISIIQVPNKSIFDASWDWFAHQTSPTQCQAVVIPRNPSSSSSLTVKIIYVSPTNGKFLCTVSDKNSVRPFANLCLYSPHDNLWDESLKISYDVRNPMVAATAIMDHWLYLAGGYIGINSCVEPEDYLNSAERLNLETGEWEILPAMQKQRSSARGIAFQGKFYVIGGRDDDRHSAEMYDPLSKEWKFIDYFLPAEFDGYAVSSLENPVSMLLLTWSELVGVKLWLWKDLSEGSAAANWQFFGYHPDQVERHKFKKNGVRLVNVGNEIWIMPGDEFGCDFYVSEGCAWPIFPAPTFMPSAGYSVKQDGHIYAFSRTLRALNWRQVSVYSMSPHGCFV